MGSRDENVNKIVRRRMCVGFDERLRGRVGSLGLSMICLGKRSLFVFDETASEVRHLLLRRHERAVRLENLEVDIVG